MGYMKGGLIGILIGTGLLAVAGINSYGSNRGDDREDRQTRSAEASVQRKVPEETIIENRTKEKIDVGNARDENLDGENKKVVKVEVINNYPITSDFVEDIIKIESNGNPKATSRVGARGLMQIMPTTWAEETKRLYGKELGFDKAFDPVINRKVGEAYLEVIRRYLSSRIDDWDSFSVEKKQELIGAAYNGGMGRLVRNDGEISGMPPETKNYVERLRKLRN